MRLPSGSNTATIRKVKNFLMKIATNVHLSFTPIDGYDVVLLGEPDPDVSMIVLMLPRNWGSLSVEKIDTLTDIVSAYPSNVRCVVIGAETTIPDFEFKKYRSPARDTAVRRLCDEVLRRSSSIGVRGKITFSYLTEVLGYSPEKVDVIYSQTSPHQQLTPEDYETIRQFLRKNECELEPFIPQILKFQQRPSQTISYERSRSFAPDIIVDSPYLTTTSTGVRLNADVEIDGTKRTIWCETDKEYADGLMHERADAFISILLPFAMRSNRNIISKAPVTENFLHNLTQILIPQLTTYDTRLYATQIIAQPDASRLTPGHAVATAMSCGVDSFYTASLYASSPFTSMNLTHLYVGNYLYGNESKVYVRAERVAAEMALPLIRTTTNLNEEIPLQHISTHFFKSMFSILSLRKLFRIYYYSTTEDFSHFDLRANGTRDTAGIELLLLYTFSCPDFQIVSGGVKAERPEKTRAIAGMPIVQRHLNVCLYPDKEINCGNCAKCMRTLLTLDMLGSLDDFTTVFPITAYRANRRESFVHLASQKKSPYLAEVYRHFALTEPSLVNDAEAEYRSRQRG